MYIDICAHVHTHTRTHTHTHARCPSTHARRTHTHMHTTRTLLLKCLHLLIIIRKLSFSLILKKFFKFRNLSLGDSYKKILIKNVYKNQINNNITWNLENRASDNSQMILKNLHGVEYSEKSLFCAFLEKWLGLN